MLYSRIALDVLFAMFHLQHELKTCKEASAEIVRSAKADMYDYMDAETTGCHGAVPCPVLKALHTVADNKADPCFFT